MMAEGIPTADWQFWFVSAVFVLAIGAVIRPLLPRKQRNTRCPSCPATEATEQRTSLTIEGKPHREGD